MSEAVRLVAPDATAASAHASIVEQLTTLCTSDSLRTWHLEVATSSLSGAGEGVRICGVCPAGTLVAVYPGVVFETEDLAVMHKMILPGNEYVMMRRDGLLIDGRPDGASSQMFSVAAQRDLAAGAAPLITSGALAIGNKVNHPAPGTLPNVFVLPFDLQPTEHPTLHPHIPTVNFRATRGKHTVVLIAKRELRDEELWLDYKLRPEGPLEQWYKPVETPFA